MGNAIFDHVQEDVNIHKDAFQNEENIKLYEEYKKWLLAEGLIADDLEHYDQQEIPSSR